MANKLPDNTDVAAKGIKRYTLRGKNGHHGN
jgi:hypothetical protein